MSPDIRNLSLENLKRAVENPRLFVREGHRLLSWPLHRLNERYLDRALPETPNVMDRDWDTLVILDACRYDYFASRSWIPEEPETSDGFQDDTVSDRLKALGYRE